MENIWLLDTRLKDHKAQWMFFGHQKDNKEDGLQMDNILVSDMCLERTQGYNG